MKNITITLSIVIFSVQLCSLGYAQNLRSPYKIDWSVDGYVAGSGSLLGLSALFVNNNLSKPTIEEINALDKNTINAFDRIAIHNYSTAQMTASDILVAASIVSPLVLLTNSRVRNDIGTFAAMYVEMSLFSNALPGLGKGIIRRFRPYTYNTAVPLSEKQQPDVVRSFFSGHTERAFAACVMTAIMYEDYFPLSHYTTHVWIASLALASACGALRVTSGAHFPTDVIVGAVIGSGIGYFIPYIHRTNNDNISLQPIFQPNYQMVTLRFTF